MNADQARVDARCDHQPADELDNAGQTELRRDGHLVAAEHAEELLRAVLGKEQPGDDAKERVNLGGEAPEDSVHDTSDSWGLHISAFRRAAALVA